MGDTSVSDGGDLPVDTTVPHTARVWNYFLGGKDNFAVDRAAGDQALAAVPGLLEMARADRAFLVRVVRHLAADLGVRQFLDVGTGLPTANNTHEVAQAAAADCRVVYVDNDPMIMSHAQALLTSTPEGATRYIHADLRDPDTILREAASILDFTRPVALLLLGIVHHVVDDEQAYAVVERLLSALPSGSYLALLHPTDEIDGDVLAEAMQRWNEAGGTPAKLRTLAEVARFFDGLELIEPGLVSTSLWRPDPVDIGDPRPVLDFGGVARKP
jgi:hypothetical protein